MNEVFRRGLAQLEREGLRVPHGLPPGSYAGGVSPVKSEEQWWHYAWDPEPSDPHASPKPSWDDLMTAAVRGAVAMKREEIVAVLRTECRARITRDVYECESVDDEIFHRLSGQETVDQRQRRRAMLNRYHGLRAQVRVDRVGDVFRFDPTDDEHWQDG